MGWRLYSWTQFLFNHIFGENPEMIRVSRVEKLRLLPLSPMTTWKMGFKNETLLKLHHRQKEENMA